jgi:hypothetical protein
MLRLTDAAVRLGRTGRSTTPPARRASHTQGDSKDRALPAQGHRPFFARRRRVTDQSSCCTGGPPWERRLCTDSTARHVPAANGAASRSRRKNALQPRARGLAAAERSAGGGARRTRARSRCDDGLFSIHRRRLHRRPCTGGARRARLPERATAHRRPPTRAPTRLPRRSPSTRAGPCDRRLYLHRRGRLHSRHLRRLPRSSSILENALHSVGHLCDRVSRRHHCVCAARNEGGAQLRRRHFLHHRRRNAAAATCWC